MLLASTLLSWLFVGLTGYAIGLGLYGRFKNNYEAMRFAVSLFGVAVIVEVVNLVVIISGDTSGIVWCLVTIVLSASTYALWEFANLPKLAQYRKISDQEKQAIENQKIIDELNERYLNAEKVVDNDR